MSSDDLKIAAFPQIRAGKIFQAMFATGVFAAAMSPQMPRGSRMLTDWRYGTELVSVCP